MKSANTRDLRIVFMGTPDFAVATLEALLEDGQKVVGVITAPDRPAGRGRAMKQSAVKIHALSKNIPVLQPLNLKDSNFLERLEALQANLQIVVAFRMLPKLVWAMPKYGTFNLHASLLPNLRGAAPINWAIMYGETTTGVTTFFIDDKIDTGEIILQEETNISEEDTAGSLHDVLMVQGAALVLKTVKQIRDNTVVRKPQREINNLKTAYKIDKDTCKVDWKKSSKEIYDHIRGLSPYPAAWCTLHIGSETLSVKIYKAARIMDTHNLEIGQIEFNKKQLKVAVADGYMELLEIQLPGKRRMPTKDVLNGLKLDNSTFIS